jgi:MYXO-CTERM domain-containing protein
MRPFLITSASIFTLAAVCSTAWAQDCATDADCPDGYACEPAGDVGGVPACDGPDCTDQTACIRREGPCTTDADCPADFVCEEVGGSGSCPVATCPAGEPCPEPEPCVIEIMTECVTMPGGVECTSTVAACQAGEECPPSTEVCEPMPDTHLCFPARVPCATDADCSGDWSCVDFVATVGELPPWWEGVNDPRACMPPGLVAVFEGRADFDESDGKNSTAADRAGSGSSAQTPGRNTSGGSEDDGGCSVAPGSTEGKGITGLLLLGLALGLRRRPGCGSR